MNKGEGGESYGFAPQGRLGQRHAETVARPSAMETPPKAEPLELPGTSPNWSWLLIGVLLGSGGTLIGSSFWLPGPYVSPSVAMHAEAEATGDSDASGSGAAEAKPIAAAADESPIVASSSPSSDEPLADLGSPEDESVGSAKDDDALPISDDAASSDAAQETELAATSPDESLASSAVASSDEGATVTLTAVDPLEQAPAATDAIAAAALDDPDRALAEIIEAATEALDDEGSPLLAEAVDQDRDAALTRTGSSIAGERQPELEATDTGAVDDVGQVTASSETGASETRSPSQRIYRVQLAAVDNEADAKVFWNEVKTRLPDVLDGMEPIFDRREVDERIFFRVWIGAFDKRVDANNYCGWLKTQGEDCFVTRG